MSASVPFVATVRSRPGVVRLGGSDGAVMTVRVEVPEVWDVVRIDAAPATSAQEVKRAALAALVPNADPARYVLKLRGFEVLDEERSLPEVGAANGSIFLLTHRRRRPVR